MNRLRRARGVIALAVVVVLSGCTTGEDDRAGNATAADAVTPTVATDGVDVEDVEDVAADCDLTPSVVDVPAGPLTSQEVDGEPLPSVIVVALDDCEPVDTAAWVGQPLVINFWASWCDPCRAEMPDLAQTAQALDGAVRFVGVTFEDRPEDSRAFLEEIPVPYDTFVDANGSDLFRAIRARGTPATVLVDAGGAIVFRHAGSISAQALTEAIDEHLGVDS